MLSKINGRERLSREFLALTEISKTLTSRCGYEKIVSVVEEANVGSSMLWDWSTGLFRTRNIHRSSP
jgi:hypothetical protein